VGLRGMRQSEGGDRSGPRIICLVGLVTAAAAAVAALVTPNSYAAPRLAGAVLRGITFQQPTVWATCVDIGKRHAGAVAGCMNTAGNLGGVASSLIFGSIVQRSGSYDAVLASMAALLLVGAALWLRIDPTESLRMRSARPG